MHADTWTILMISNSPNASQTKCNDRRIIVSVSSFEAKKDGLLDSLPYMIVYLRDAVLSFIQEFEKAKNQ